MTQPRRVVAGMTAMITRRTLLRTHLLRPDNELSQLFLYCLAVTSKRFGVRVHCVTVMSSHEHLVVTDTRGQLPRFTQEFHRLLALGIKCLRRWDGAVWDHEKTSVVELRTSQAILEKMAYCIANPVAAGLVRRAHQWPGINTSPEQLGRMSWTVKRPRVFFDQDNPQWPDVATLQLCTPPDVDVDGAAAREIVAAEVTRLEAQAKIDLEAKGWKIFGREAVASMSPYERASSAEPLRSRNPAFAVGRGQREAFFQAVAVLRAFRRAHRAALDLWRAGSRYVCFPAGTWLMRWAHGASVEAPA